MSFSETHLMIFEFFLRDFNTLEPGMTVGRLSVLWALSYLLPWSQHFLAKKLRNSAQQMEGDVSSLGIFVEDTCFFWF